MGPVADLLSYAMMYAICAAIGGAMIGFAYGRRGRLAFAG